MHAGKEHKGPLKGHLTAQQAWKTIVSIQTI